MKPKFRKTIEKIKAAPIKAGAKEPIPRVRFSADIRGKLVDYSDRLDYFEGMTILLESHPFFPFGNKFSLGDILDYRRALAYEIIIRFLGHCRSLIANSNIFNHIGTAVALRCMLELYAFLIYLKHNNYKDDAKILEKLLHGSFLSSGSGEWYEYEQVWKQKRDEPLPDNFKEFVKTLLKTPRVGKYLKSVNDQGFDYMYAIYSNFVHPTFGRPRSQFLEDIGQESVGIALEDSNYYLLAQKQPSPPNSLKRDISAAGFCLQLSWPEIMALDPFFDKELGIFKATD